MAPTMKLTRIASIPAHTDRIWQCTVHPSSPLVATASSDRCARLLSLTSYTVLSTIDGGHKRSIRSVAWKPNTKGESVLATGSFDATAGIWRRWDTDTEYASSGESADGEDEWRFAVVLDGHESEIKSVAWSAGGSFLATCSRDKSVWVWEELDDDNFETVGVLQEHTQDVKCVSWHPEEVFLASSSYDDTIRLYREDLDDWVCVSVMNDHKATVWCVQFEPLGWEGKSARLLSCSDDLTVRIWEREEKSIGGNVDNDGKPKVPSILRSAPLEEEWKCVSVLPRTHKRSIYSCAWSPKSRRIVSCSGDGKIVVYEEGGEKAEGEAKTGDGEKVGEGSEPGPGQWRIVAEFEGAHNVFEVNSVSWSKRYDKDKRSDDEEIIISCGDDGEVNIWQLD